MMRTLGARSEYNSTHTALPVPEAEPGLDMFMSMLNNLNEQTGAVAGMQLRGMMQSLGNLGDLFNGATTGAANQFSGLLQRLGNDRNGEGLLAGLRNGSLFSRMSNIPIFG